MRNFSLEYTKEGEELDLARERGLWGGCSGVEVHGRWRCEG